MADSGTITTVVRPRAAADGTPLGSSCRRVVLVAPGPVDEVRAVGLLAPLDGAAPEVDLLALTGAPGPADPDEASDDLPDDLPDPHHPAVLEAYARVGATEVRRHRLGLAVGDVAVREADVVAALSEILGWAHPAGLVVLAPPSGPDRSDPDAAGRAAELVCAAYRVRLVTWDPDAVGAGPTSRGAVVAPVGV